MQNKHSRIVSAAAEQGEDKMRIALPEPFGLFERSAWCNRNTSVSIKQVAFSLGHLATLTCPRA